MKRALALRVLAVGLTLLTLVPASLAGERIRWETWSDAVFERARHENRLVLLDLEAVWCHWCHVMDETTYADPAIAALVGERFIAVRVDQDARPDLSNRYEDYGWPATVLFDGQGTELAKLAGYVPPLRMISLLRAFADDPTPGPSAASPVPDTWAADAFLAPDLRRDLETIISNRYDDEHGGWGFVHKFLDWDNAEYALTRARTGDREAERMASETLHRQLQLIDPVWGGVYQYSDSGDWDHPHFEKIMSMQAEDLRLYAQSYALWHDPAHLQAARQIHRYLSTFLTSPEGAFYTSQDADLLPGEHSAEYYGLSDAERRAKGIPRVDTHLYTRENAWAANALTVLYDATGEAPFLDQALCAAHWILDNRALPGGGFRHDAADPAGPYLGDTVAAGRAFLALYAATADRAWLARAELAAAFITHSFRREGVVGFATAASRDALGDARPQRDENILMARFANLLFHYTGKAEHRRLAEHAMRYLATPAIARRFETGGVLLVDEELRSEPLHVTVVGPRDDPDARRLLLAALADPSSYKRVELWDRRDGPLPHGDVDYPPSSKPAAYLCSGNRCSSPAFTADELRARLARSAPASPRP